MSHAHHGAGASVTVEGVPRIALVGSPNSGKSTLFNALSGLHTRTGNYPGMIELEGDELAEVVEEILDPDDTTHSTPDAVIATVDATTMRRSLGLIAQVLAVGLPTTVVVTFTDELARRNGHLDLSAPGPSLRATRAPPANCATIWTTGPTGRCRRSCRPRPRAR